MAAIGDGGAVAGVVAGREGGVVFPVRCSTGAGGGAIGVSAEIGPQALDGVIPPAIAGVADLPITAARAAEGERFRLHDLPPQRRGAGIIVVPVRHLLFQVGRRQG